RIVTVYLRHGAYHSTLATGGVPSLGTSAQRYVLPDADAPTSLASRYFTPNPPKDALACRQGRRAGHGQRRGSWCGLLLAGGNDSARLRASSNESSYLPSSPGRQAVWSTPLSTANNSSRFARSAATASWIAGSAWRAMMAAT